MSSPAFESAFKALLRIKPSYSLRYISINMEALRMAYEVSPSFALLKPQLEAPAGRNWTNPTFDTLGIREYGPWFMWALRNMTANAGYYKDPNATRLFYRKVAQEIDLACADGYYVYLVIAMAWTSLAALLLIVSRFRRVRLSNPLVVTLILLGAAIVSRLIFFSFLDATWWMDGYERYIFPIMPMTSCFFILLIYQAIAIWRNRSGFPTPVSNQC